MGLLSFLDSGDDFARAEKLVAKGRCAEALPLYAKSFADNRRPAEAAFKSGLLCYSVRDFQQTENWLNKSVRMDPSNAKACEILSLAQTMNGKFEDAERSAEQGLAVASEKAQVFLCKMALIQSLVNQIALLSAHKDMDKPLRPLEQIIRRDQLASQALELTEECLEAGRDAAEIWNFRALIGIYHCKPELFKRAMRRLRELRSAYYGSLHAEYEKVWGFRINEEF